MTHSQPTVTPHIDPEDRIFDSSSNSSSSADSDTDHPTDNSISARQRLLSDLQRQLDNFRANALELTQGTPGARDTSQVSSVTRQISDITIRLPQTRQQNLSPQSVSTHRTMSSRDPLADDFLGRDWDEQVQEAHELMQETHEQIREVHEQIQEAQERLQEAHQDEGSHLRYDEALRQRLARLDREESSARAAMLALRDPSNERQSLTAQLEGLTTMLQGAEQDQTRLEALARGSGMREETGRPAAGYQNPFTSLFGPQTQTRPGSQDYITAYNNSVVAASAGQPSDSNRVWASRYNVPFLGVRSGGGSTEASNPLSPANYGLSGTCNSPTITSCDDMDNGILAWLMVGLQAYLQASQHPHQQQPRTILRHPPPALNIGRALPVRLRLSNPALIGPIMWLDVVLSSPVQKLNPLGHMLGTKP
ncbi:MAG: hypothetical protein L6R39_005743 [Caloplaca ligustica]|nr:MAG: hypothetical protein L6R39_005743 [Caloplaca ligustica]